jgi:hypothetical protein
VVLLIGLAWLSTAQTVTSPLRLLTMSQVAPLPQHLRLSLHFVQIGQDRLKPQQRLALSSLNEPAPQGLPQWSLTGVETFITAVSQRSLPPPAKQVWSSDGSTT